MAPTTRNALPGPAPRSWFLPPWIPLLLLIAPLWWLVRHGDEAAAREGFGWLDPAAVELDFPAPWVDPAWEDQVFATIADFGSVRLDDGAGLRALGARLAALPFVAETDHPRVVWPAGIEFPLRLRRPVACVGQHANFVPVDREGVLLGGEFRAPPRVEQGYLPVLGPVDQRTAALRPGDRLSDPEDLDALAIAEALGRHLAPEDLARLGRIVIDARRAPLSSATEPGALLLLEGRRTVAFGRSPRIDHPGELALETKCAHLARALEQLHGAAPRDWSGLDVRWDTPAYVDREVPR
jgi:hypothetical protein